MRREPLFLASVLALLGGCATLLHGPYQEVALESNPPGATATIMPTLSERGTNYLDPTKQYTVTTPATVRLRRDNTYRVDIQKSGYKLATTKLVSSYDWLNAPVACGPCELIGDLPTYDLKGGRCRCASWRGPSTSTRAASSPRGGRGCVSSAPRRCSATPSSSGPGRAASSRTGTGSARRRSRPRSSRRASQPARRWG